MSFEGFSRTFIRANGVDLSVRIGGDGPPLVLLHGFPQNHMCWGKVVGSLSDRFRCIIPDLRGYGDSSCPPDDPEHFTYSKRNMALDIVSMLDQLEVGSASFVGHDRGARVSYRLAIDHPERVRKMVIVEVVPTAEFWKRWDYTIAMAGYHWTFLAQPAPFPERLIAADPEFFVNWTVSGWTAAGNTSAFSPEALASYVSQMQQPERVSAMCADYRAGATMDRKLDEIDMAEGRMIEAPVKFIWSTQGFPSKAGDPLAIWRPWCRSLSGESVDGCGHFMMEENPAGFTRSALSFLGDGGSGLA